MNDYNKIALFLPGMYGGGAERIILNLAREFYRNGYIVDLVLAEGQGPLMSMIPTGINIVTLSQTRLRRFRTMRTLPALIRYLRDSEPAWMLSALHANYVALMAKMVSGVKTRFMISEHNTFSKQIDTLPITMKAATALIARILYTKADAIVAVSEGVAKDLASYFKLSQKRIHVIYNPIVTEEMASLCMEPTDHSWLNGGNGPVLVSIGRLTAAKDHPTLIAAFKIVRSKLPLKLIILGEGEERARLQSLIEKEQLQDDIQMLGFVDNPLPFLKRADLFVLSSRWEGLPTVLVEAMYCKAPIIATDCPSGPKEILKNGEYGELVPVGDRSALAEKIYDCLLNPRSAAPPDSWMPYTSTTAARRYLELMAGFALCNQR